MQADEGSLHQDEHFGDPALTEQAALRRLPGLRALLFRITRNVDITNDLAQEVLLAVVLAIRAGRIREPAALNAYMHQAARNAALMQHRKPMPLALNEASEIESLWGERPRTPLEYCEEEELRRLARQVLDELPTQRDRELMSGFYVDGISKGNLMHRFGLDKDQFDRVISRARGRMRDLLEAKMNEKTARLRGVGAIRFPSGTGPGRRR